MPGHRASLEERLWAKVQRGDPDDCWPWTGYVDPSKGYGSIGMGGRGEGTTSTARAAYLVGVGPIPEGAHVDHTCHNDTGCEGGPDCPHRRCCNPAHLEAVTHAENVRRGKAGHWQTHKTHCPHGHEYTSENTFDNNGGRGCKTCRRGWNQKYTSRINQEVQTA